MSNRRKAAPWRRSTAHGHGLDCGCTGYGIFECHGTCDVCGAEDMFMTGPMPTGLPLGGVAEVGWPCSTCASGEVVGHGVLVEVAPAIRDY